MYIIIFVVAGYYYSFKSRYTALDQLLLQRLQGWDGCYLNSLMAGLKARSTMVMVHIVDHPTALFLTNELVLYKIIKTKWYCIVSMCICASEFRLGKVSILSIDFQSLLADKSIAYVNWTHSICTSIACEGC